MANTTLTWTNRRVLPTADWDNLKEATDQITFDIQSALTNTEVALVNDAYMTGAISSSTSYVNSTCIEVTHTLTGNTTFVNDKKADHEQHKASLQTLGYTITEI